MFCSSFVLVYTRCVRYIIFSSSRESNVSTHGKDDGWWKQWPTKSKSERSTHQSTRREAPQDTSHGSVQESSRYVFPQKKTQKNKNTHHTFNQVGPLTHALAAHLLALFTTLCWFFLFAYNKTMTTYDYVCFMFSFLLLWSL